MEDRKFIFHEILNWISSLGCSYDYYEFHDFVVNKRGTEFRLGGEFGSGFTLHRNEAGSGFKLPYNNYEGLFWFGQHLEDATSRSLQWIKDRNDLLMKFNFNEV
ncbi:hypothetical protein NDS46_30455 (plasmid) [Paenibacillus thiaminolyticus]|uniref:hypothetical protein n=1 Tax=Paenibacillus thiaminolyticus TaxID=49283 RepID=UPI00232E61D1|nr:hypothetical protein [Paenibacillus thiaminolyticus]WCF11671.1 hypothetical protein NDS46_30455 [Paenibacillus thiaminolyticus]